MAKLLTLENMARLEPAEITKFLECELNIKNIFMVVGKPGSGKSTFLKIIKEIDSNVYGIDTDAYSKELRPLFEQQFGNADFIDIAINRPAELIETIATKWLEMAAASLAQAPVNANVFVEVPYGLRPEFEMFRYFGAKVIYIGNENPEQNEARIRARGNPQTMRFLEVIPGKNETAAIAAKKGLQVTYIDTSKTLTDLRADAKVLLDRINAPANLREL